MIRIRDISLLPEHGDDQLLLEAAKALKISSSAIEQFSIVRKSIDARKKPNVRVIYTVDVAVIGSEDKILRNSGCKRAGIAKINPYSVKPVTQQPKLRPVVVGFGPAGMFAALVLSMAGLKPIVLERGEEVKTRQLKVRRFFETGELDTQSNVQFGEGGAGTFSDGKLNTGVNNPRIGWILSQFVSFGAKENILYDAKPHIGTDILCNVVQNLRNHIIGLGAEVRFSTQVTGLQIENNRLVGLQTTAGDIPCDHAVFAIGHSARDTFTMLHNAGVSMEAKPFSMGVRIEHRQEDINVSQYGQTDTLLPPADYKLVKHLDEQTVYTFCMCPGGQVVAAASEEGGVVTNGMSNTTRDGENANAALLVTVNPKDFPYEGVLGGMYWQREIEQRAFAVSGSYRAPAQLVGDFLSARASTCDAGIKPTYRPGVYWCNLHEVLPKKITSAILKALPQMEQNLKGFANENAVMTAPETRSSSPVRILRNDCRVSSVLGLYPCGEGAGYAGGIMSAAIDGMMTAEAILSQFGGI